MPASAETRSDARKLNRRGSRVAAVAAIAAGTLVVGTLVVAAWPGNSASTVTSSAVAAAAGGDPVDRADRASRADRAAGSDKGIGTRPVSGGSPASGVTGAEPGGGGTAFVDEARGAAFDAATSVRRMFHPEAGNGPIVTYKELAAAAAADAVKPAPGHATEKRSADEALPKVELTADAKIIDTSDELSEGFGYLARAMQPSNGHVAAEITMTSDSCLLAWARKTMPTLHGAGKTSTPTVCGRTAAVIAGGYSTSGSDLLLHAMYGSDKAKLGAILLNTRALDYASLSTDDGKAILIVVAQPARGGSGS